MTATTTEHPGSRIPGPLARAAMRYGLRLVHLHNWRVLPTRHRDRMMMQLHELGWTMEEIALLTGINAHRTTVARAIRAGRSARDLR